MPGVTEWYQFSVFPIDCPSFGSALIAHEFAAVNCIESKRISTCAIHDSIWTALAGEVRHYAVDEIAVRLRVVCRSSITGSLPAPCRVRVEFVMTDLNVDVAASPLEAALALTPARPAAVGRALPFAQRSRRLHMNWQLSANS
jgi:hypothetical protein